MTTYNYKCLDCGSAFGIEATIQEKEEGTSEKFACPKCGTKNIRQEFSAVNFIKNIFKSDEKVGGCCSGGNVRDIKCKQDDKKNDCGDKNSNGGCCG